MKVCTNCKLSKPLEDFYNAKSFKDGKTYECKTCMSLYRNKNKEKNRAYSKKRNLEQSEKCRESDKKYYNSLSPDQKMLQRCRSRAKTKNIPFNLTLEDIIIPEKCPLLECYFEKGKGYAYPYTYSLDRIDNTKGYVRGNVQVITMRANNMKNAATKKELLTFAKNIILQYKDNDIVQHLIEILNVDTR